MEVRKSHICQSIAVGQDYDNFVMRAAREDGGGRAVKRVNELNQQL